MTVVSQKNSKNSGEQSIDLKKFAKPKSVKELAEQANTIATMILNDEISLDKAGKYTTAVRNVAQLKSIEVYKSRFTKIFPDLEL